MRAVCASVLVLPIAMLIFLFFLGAHGALTACWQAGLWHVAALTALATYT